MKAIFRHTVHDATNSSFVLEQQTEVPDTGPTDILIQVKACGLSLPGVKILNELFKKNPRLQHPVGQEVAGEVTQVGSEVTTVAIGDRVTGLVPLDSPHPGCAEYCFLSEYDAVKLPDEVSFTDAAAVIGDGVKAYTALHYNGHLCGGDTVLVIDGASSWGSLAVQLAQNWGAKVLATASTDEGKGYLDDLQPALAQVIELRNKNSILYSSIMEETGGVGVDLVVDNGVRQFSNEEDVALVGENYRFPVPSKHDIISCLGVGGRWVTTKTDLQLDPPDSMQLYLKGGSVSYLFHHIWTLSSAQYGRYHHIMRDLLSKVAARVLKPNITKCVSLEEAITTLKTFHDFKVGKVVMEL